MTSTEQWIYRAGWVSAHVLRPHSTSRFLGTEYARTLCGRNIRTDHVAAYRYGDRCKRCTNIVASSGGV